MTQNPYDLSNAAMNFMKHYVERWENDWERRFQQCRYDRKAFDTAKEKSSHALRAEDVASAVRLGIRYFIDFYQEFIDLDWTDDPQDFGKHLGQAAATCEFFKDVREGRILPF